MVTVIHEVMQCIIKCTTRIPKYFYNALYKFIMWSVPKISYNNLNLCPLSFLCTVLGQHLDGNVGQCGSALVFFEWKIWKGHSWVRGVREPPRRGGSVNVRENPSGEHTKSCCVSSTAWVKHENAGPQPVTHSTRQFQLEGRWEREKCSHLKC